MNEEQLKNSLNELAQKTTEKVSPELAENIKHRIPHDFHRLHHGRMNTINVMIDLRISKLTAAAAIILAVIMLPKNINPPTPAEIPPQSKRSFFVNTSGSGGSG